MVKWADIGDELAQPGGPEVFATVRGCAAEDAGSSHTGTVAEGTAGPGAGELDAPLGASLQPELSTVASRPERPFANGADFG